MLARRVTLFTFSLLLLAGGPAGAQQTTLAEAPESPLAREMFFFSPDWRPSNINVVAAALRQYIAEEGLGLRFQAFDRHEDLMREVEARHPPFLQLPVWAAEDPNFPAKLTALSTPVLEGRSSYRKALMAKSGITGLPALAGRSLAATVPGKGTAGLQRMLPGLPLSNGRIGIIAVPKDIDALLALCFGQVDAALVTEAEYKKLLAVNPAITQGLITLTYTRDISFPRYYATEWATPEMREEARKLLTGLGTTTGGRTILALFGYDGIRLIPDNGDPALETSRPAAPR